MMQRQQNECAMSSAKVELWIRHNMDWRKFRGKMFDANLSQTEILQTTVCKIRNTIVHFTQFRQAVKKHLTK